MLDKRIGEMEFCAVDVETSGLFMSSRLVEVGAVRFDSEGIRSEFHTLVDPREPIHPAATAIHGISDDMVAGCPPPGAAVAGLLEWLGGGVFVAHNARFDTRVIALELVRAGLETPDNPVVDTVVLARRMLGGLPDYRLGTLVDHLGMDATSRHRGLPDAVAAMEIFRVCLLDGHPDLLLGDVPGLLGRWNELVPPTDMEFRGGASDLHELARRRLVVEIVYDGGTDPGIPRMITPLSLFGNGPWVYVRAYCHRSGVVKTFRVDRINGIRLP